MKASLYRVLKTVLALYLISAGAIANGSWSSRDILVQTHLDLQTVLVSASFEEEKDFQRIEKAIEHLAESLDLSYWTLGVGDTLTDDGKKIFYGVRKAAKDLEKTEGRLVELAGSLEEMFAATCSIAENEINYRLGSSMVLDEQAILDLLDQQQDKEIDKALENYLEAVEDHSAQEIPDAIKRCKEAWKHARKAPQPENCELIGTC